MGIILSKDEFEAFIEDPGHAVSCNPQYEKQLRMRLDRLYDTYIKITVYLLYALKWLGRSWAQKVSLVYAVLLFDGAIYSTLKH